MKLSAYEKNALRIAEEISIEIRTCYQGGQCPEWGASRDARRDRHACEDCGGVHGDKYRVTIKRKGKGPGAPNLSFDYWASWASCNKTVRELRAMKHSEIRELGIALYGSLLHEHDSKTVKVKHKPSYYDILACLSFEVFGSTDPDAIYEEFGEMKPSQALRIAEHNRKVQAFFTEAERLKIADVENIDSPLAQLTDTPADAE